MKTIDLISTLLFLLLNAGAGSAAGAEKADGPLKVKIADLPPSFRDVSIELRCTALSGFVSAFAGEYLNELGYKEAGCSEGNGIGGATYELEFKLSNVPDVKAYSLQIAMEGKTVPATKICMQSGSDTFCSKEYISVPGTAETHFNTVSDQKGSAFVNRNYIQPGIHLSKLLPSVVAWVGGDQKFNRIFGRDFQTFVGSMLNKSLEVPVTAKEKTTTLKIELVPSHAGSATGSAKLLSDLPGDLQSCLGCSDRQCQKLKLSYSFNNRFLAISGVPSDKTNTQDLEKSKIGLAWVMDGPDPFLKGEPDWRFFCGVSRYSVQVIKN